jgi:hypothetical protein
MLSTGLSRNVATVSGGLILEVSIRGDSVFGSSSSECTSLSMNYVPELNPLKSARLDGSIQSPHNLKAAWWKTQSSTPDTLDSTHYPRHGLLGIIVYTIYPSHTSINGV